MVGSKPVFDADAEKAIVLYKVCMLRYQLYKDDVYEIV